MKNKGLAYLAIVGGTLLATNFVLPIVDTASAWVQNKIGVENAKLIKQVNEINADTQPQPTTMAVGFDYQSCDCDCDECE